MGQRRVRIGLAVTLLALTSAGRAAEDARRSPQAVRGPAWSGTVLLQEAPRPRPAGLDDWATP